MELRRSLDAPGEVALTLPPASGLRRIRVECAPPPSGRVSAMLLWTPTDHPLSVRIERIGASEPIAKASGQSPVVLGSAVDSAPGKCALVIEDAAGGTDTLELSLQLNWSGAVERPRPALPVETAPVPGAPENRMPPPPATPSLTCRITEISWREGADVDRSKLARDGLRIKFGSAINKEMLAGAIRCSVGFPGSQEGLERFEEIQYEMRVADNEVTLYFPPKLFFSKRTPVRVTVLGDRLLARDGTFVDGEGSGYKLPSGNGMPGGIFQSEFFVTP